MTYDDNEPIDYEAPWYAVKVKFQSSSKLYEYALPRIPKPLSLDNCYGVVDARGEPKIVKIVDIIPYHDRIFDGDLKPVMAIFIGSVYYTKPDRPREPKKRRSENEDDKIPF